MTHFIDEAGVCVASEVAFLVVALGSKAEKGASSLLCPAGLCTGWGQSHYSTFDGTSYTFSDNCTYVLMREINPTHGNLTILIHNRYCSIAAEAASCPRALQVHYESMEIILTTSTTSGKRESVVSLCGR
jgi:hypothetical protein